jgi:hypothetical protein
MAAFLEERIRRFEVESPTNLRWLAADVSRLGALPLFVDLLETFGLRPDGEVIRWSTEGLYAGPRPVEDRILLLAALVDGCRRYAELESLLPVRSPDAVDCQCQEIPQFAESGLICDKCGGLGWVPE